MLSLLSRRSTEATMPPNSEASPAPVTEEEGQEKKSRSSSSVRKLFKGVRRRKWGRWVSEIRVPRSRSRIWLGSYDTAEKAARAYDAALYCLRGDVARFNFPAAEIPPLSEERRLALTNAEVKAIAARHAFSPSKEAEGSTSSSSESTSAMTNVVAGAWEVDCSHCWDFSCESLLLADAAAEIGGEVVSVWDLL